MASGGNATFSYTGVTVSGTNATFTGLSLTAGTGSWTVAANAVVNTGQRYVVYLNNAVPVSCSAIKTGDESGDRSRCPSPFNLTGTSIARAAQPLELQGRGRSLRAPHASLVSWFASHF